MSTMLALVMTGAASLLLSRVIGKKTEEILPVAFCSIIAVLFPFYCLGVLTAGRILLYLLFLAAAVWSVVTMRRQGKNAAAELVKGVSPGICIYAALCIFFFLYTRGYFVWLWDELRLWGAVPKALYETGRLQLGGEAQIFPSMQSYPPAMPLFIYFFTSLSPVFPENQIFSGYAIFAASMLVPSLSALKWRQWPLFVPAAAAFAVFPCLFTSHGGDFSWFYESLFIDAVLGIAAGYVFYLAATKPFSSRFSTYRFCAALMTVAMLKDSGAAFAIVAFCCGALLCLVEADRPFEKKRFLCRGGLALGFVGGPYLIWKELISHFGVSNHLGFQRIWPDEATVEALLNNLARQPMLVFSKKAFLASVSLSFWACLLGIALISFLITKKGRDISSKTAFITAAAIALSGAAFMIGYGNIFGESLPSFQRYMSTPLLCAGTYVMLRGIPVCVAAFPWEWEGTRLYRAKNAAAAILACGLILSSARGYLNDWAERKYTVTGYPNVQGLYATAHYHAANIRNAVSAEEDDPAKVYLLISGSYADNSRMHHRIYLNLIGTEAVIHNFLFDVRIVYEDDLIDIQDPRQVSDLAQDWTGRLRADGYDYVYVYSVDEHTEAVFEELACTEPPRTGMLYELLPEGDGLLFAGQPTIT